MNEDDDNLTAQTKDGMQMKGSKREGHGNGTTSQGGGDDGDHLGNIIAIVPAAGRGERCHQQHRFSSHPKQYEYVDGHPLIVHTVGQLLENRRIGLVILVVAQNEIDRVSKLFKQYKKLDGKVHVTGGGSSRHKSIFAGLKYISSELDKPRLVVIHDGVRPHIEQRVLNDLIESASKHGAAGPAVDMVSTVIKISSEESVLEESLPRHELLASETPQVFGFDTIFSAYEQCSEEDLERGTECLALVSKYAGVKAKIIKANASDFWKVTHPKDIFAIEGFFRSQRSVHLRTKVYDESRLNDEFLSTLYSILQNKFSKIKVIVPSGNDTNATAAGQSSEQQPQSQNAGLKSLSNECCLVIHFCKNWPDVFLTESLRLSDNYNFAVQIMITSQPLEPGSHYELNTLVKEMNAESNVIFIHVQLKNLLSVQEKLSKTVTHLLWTCPEQMSGQVLYF